jgi:hypothetical protein
MQMLSVEARLRVLDYGTIIHRGYVRHTPIFDDNDLIFTDYPDLEDL